MKLTCGEGIRMHNGETTSNLLDESVVVSMSPGLLLGFLEEMMMVDWS